MLRREKNDLDALEKSMMGQISEARHEFATGKPKSSLAASINSGSRAASKTNSVSYGANSGSSLPFAAGTIDGVPPHAPAGVSPPKASPGPLLGAGGGASGSEPFNGEQRLSSDQVHDAIRNFNKANSFSADA